MPSPISSFIDDFISLINELSTSHRMLTVSDFNLDQKLLERVGKVGPVMQILNSLSSQYSTHTHRGILDLVFDTSNCNTVSFFAITLQ